MNKVAVRFETKGRGPNATLAVSVHHPVKKPPTALFEELNRAGWNETFDLPPYSGIKERSFFKPGTGLFTGWTPKEAKEYRTEARKILRGFGFVRVPIWYKTLADLL